MSKVSHALCLALGWVAFTLMTSEITHAYSQSGIASYYWQPQKVASGGYFNPQAMTAAHKTLSFGTKVRVTHIKSGNSVVVTINDRGPYIKGRIIDLSLKAATVLGIRKSGIARVNIAVVGKGASKSSVKKAKAKKTSKAKPKKKWASKSKKSNKNKSQKPAKSVNSNSEKAQTPQTVQVVQLSSNSTVLDIDELILR